MMVTEKRIGDILHNMGLELDMDKVNNHPFLGKFLDSDVMILDAEWWVTAGDDEVDFFNPISMKTLRDNGMVKSKEEGEDNMTIKEVVQYIRKREAEGISDLQIDDELLDMGATMWDINDANDIYCAEYYGGAEETE